MGIEDWRLSRRDFLKWEAISAVTAGLELSGLGKLGAQEKEKSKELILPKEKADLAFSDFSLWDDQAFERAFPIVRSLFALRGVSEEEKHDSNKAVGKWVPEIDGEEAKKLAVRVGINQVSEDEYRTYRFLGGLLDIQLRRHASENPNYSHLAIKKTATEYFEGLESTYNLARFEQSLSKGERRPEDLIENQVDLLVSQSNDFVKYFKARDSTSLPLTIQKVNKAMRNSVWAGAYYADRRLGKYQFLHGLRDGVGKQIDAFIEHFGKKGGYQGVIDNFLLFKHKLTVPTKDERALNQLNTHIESLFDSVSLYGTGIEQDEVEKFKQDCVNYVYYIERRDDGILKVQEPQ